MQLIVNLIILLIRTQTVYQYSTNES